MGVVWHETLPHHVVKPRDIAIVRATSDVLSVMRRDGTGVDCQARHSSAYDNHTELNRASADRLIVRQEEERSEREPHGDRRQKIAVLNIDIDSTGADQL